MTRAQSNNASFKRAYCLYVGYKTQTTEYRQIAASMGLGSGELNRQMWGIYTARLRARSTRRYVRTADRPQSGVLARGRS